MTRKRPSFGFAELAAVPTSARTNSGSTLESFEGLAARLGFVSREPLALQSNLNMHNADAVHLTIQATRADRDIFVRYCRTKDITEVQAFSKLVLALKDDD